MQIPTRSRQFGLRFNITPLIDIVFLLIIFFLVASHFVKSESHEPVDLPVTPGAKSDDEQQPRRVTITVKENGQMIVNGRTTPIAELSVLLTSLRAEERGAETEIRIRGDRRAKYRHFEPILLECAKVGLVNVKTAVMSTGAR